MKMTIEISPEDEMRLQEEAARRGTTPNDLLQIALNNLLGPAIENRPSWSAAAGMFPYPMAGEDAQAWVTRSRQQGNEHRERLLNQSELPAASSDKL